MRIALTVPDLAREFGGPVVQALGLAPALRELGCEVEVLGCGEVPGATGLGYLTRFHATPVPRRIGPIFRAVRRADVVHVMGYRDPVGTFAAVAARWTRTPLVLEPLGMYGAKLRSARIKALYEWAIGSRIFRQAVRIVATSRIEAEDLGEEVTAHSKVVVRPNGLSLDNIYPSPERGAFRKRLGLAPDVPLVLAVSRISMTKGLTILPAVARMMEDVHFVVAGPDDGDGTFATLRELCQGIEDRFTIMPEGLWGADKAQALADAECFCLPSATESFGNAAAEAAAVGLPVALSDRCGVRDVLRGPSIGIFTYGDVDDCAAVLRGLIDDPQIRSAAQGYAPKVRQQLNWETVATMQLEMYRQAVSAHSAGRER